MPKAKDPRIEIMAARARALVAECGSIAEAARLGGVSVNTVSRMCAGSHEPGVIAAAAFAKGLGVSVEYLLGYPEPESVPRATEAPPAVIPEAETIQIPELDVRVAAGDGTSADVVRAVGSVPFPKVWVRKLASPDARLACLRVQGDSMEPTITHGAILIIDERQRAPRPYSPAPKKSRPKVQADEIFVFYYGGDLRLKRLRDLGGGDFAILSDNDSLYGIEIHRRHSGTSLKIIGKVIWWDNRL
jgi:phage repressor protein C with HTH and peptisase S24 domain